LDLTDTGDLQLLNYNGKAYMLLSLSISPSDSITFNAVQNPLSDRLPLGDTKQAWKNIYEINQLATKADQDETKNPDKWFSKLENNWI
jgi:hypothetical protein